MAIDNADLEKIGTYVKDRLPGWIDDMRQRWDLEIPIQLLERMVRVEEELKAQRELITVRFEVVDRRFETVDQRFEDVFKQMDTRFDGVNQQFKSIDQRFEDMNKRFSAIQWVMGIGFVMIGTLVTVFGVFA